MRHRMILYALWFYGLTVVLSLLYLPFLVLPRPAIRAGVKVWARLLVWGLRVIGGVRLQVRGLERLPPGPILMAAKHQSMFDIIPAFAVMPDPLFVMKRELMRIPLFGAFCRKAGMIEIDRSGQAQALRKLIADARDRFKEPRQLLIFPEGTRRPPGAAPDYKPGVAGIYRELGLPCVPVATNTGARLDFSGLPTSSGVVVYEILEPIPAGLKRADFMRVLQERVEAASNALP